MRQRFSQYRELKTEDDDSDRKHIQNRRHEGIEKINAADHATTMPKTMTNIIGNNEAKAIKPNPSNIGLRPLIDEANPTPKAVTNGTVMVDVVTPPNRKRCQ